MSSLVPHRPSGLPPEPESPRLLHEVLGDEERRLRWAVRAAYWKAHALAREVFSGEVETRLVGMRTRGELHGILQVDVPFRDLETHREAEARFLAAAGSDPLLASVPLLYAVGPRVD